MVNALKRAPRAAAATGTIFYHDDTSRVWYGGGRIIPWRASGFSEHLNERRRPDELGSTRRVTFISGCLMLLRASVLEAMGGFDERFFMYLEDVDLCSRLSGAGHELLYVPQSHIQHKVGKGGHRPYALYFMVRNRLLFLSGWKRPPERWGGMAYLYGTVAVEIDHMELRASGAAPRGACRDRRLSSRQVLRGPRVEYAMIRLVVDSGNSRTASGVGVYTGSLLAALRAYGGDEVRVEESTFSEARSTLRPLWRVRYFWRLRKAIQEEFGGADVAHFTNVFVPGKSARCAYVATIHDLEPLLFPHVTTRRYVAYYRWAVEKALATADIVLTDTEAVRGEIIDRFPFASGKIRACGIGLSPAFATEADRVPAQPRSGPPLLLFVGTLTKKKNVSWLTRTVARGVREGALPKLQLVLAGHPGHGHEEIEAAVARAGDVASIVHRPDLGVLASLYRAASALVLPSHTEGFGIPLIEAAYCGVPIVASKIPTSLEVAAGCGEFFSLGNDDEFFHAVRAVLDHGSSPAFQDGLRACVRRYSWEHLVPSYMSAYREAVGRRSQGAK